MNTLDLLQYSLNTSFEVLTYVTNDLTQEQVDWEPPGVANSIGSILSHLVTYLDLFIREIYIKERYEFLITGPPQEIIMRHIQVDLHELQERKNQIITFAEDWLSSLTPQDLEAELETAIGNINVAQMIEAYIIWHINVHCGEISLLKGCQGAKGYPW